MPDYMEYQKSISKEFKAYENRVRNLIDNVNWAEEGRYKEVILMNYLKRILPKNLSVGTGFVRNGDQITTQIDVIIYENSIPLLFSEGDFVVTTPENVIGIIEVKSRFRLGDLKEIIEKANENGYKIAQRNDKNIFNGIFSYSTYTKSNYMNILSYIDMTNIVKPDRFNQICNDRLRSCVNHISIGADKFIKLWPYNKDDNDNLYAEYSFYELSDGLGISYFLSNLQEAVLRRSIDRYIEPLEEHYQAIYYPIPEGKALYKIDSKIQRY